jgi:hypothetical protein
MKEAAPQPLLRFHSVPTARCDRLRHKQASFVQGKVTEQSLRQLFDEALSTTFPHLLTPGVKPCLSVAMHSEGRYAFVELATPEMATAALQLSGQLNFLGSQMTVGRPSGYIDPAKAAAAAAAASKALQELSTDGDVTDVLARGDAPPPSLQPTPCLCIDNMIGPSVFTDEMEYQVGPHHLQLTDFPQFEDQCHFTSREDSHTAFNRQSSTVPVIAGAHRGLA